MSYKNRLCHKVSNGEIDVFSALSKSGLTNGMVTQAHVVLKSTVPDFCWHQKKKAVYLDGVQVHRKAHVEARDEEINTLMIQKGWQILRIPYEPPLTTIEVTEIVKQIKEFLNNDSM